MTPRVFGWLLTILVGLTVQGSLLRELMPFETAPNILFAIVVFLAVREGGPKGALGAFVLGIVLDVSGGQAIGPWAAASQVVYAMFVWLLQGFFIRSTFTVMLAGAVSMFLGGCVAIGLTGSADLFSFRFLGTLLFEALLTGLISPIVFAVLTRFSRPVAELSLATRRKLGGI